MREASADNQIPWIQQIPDDWETVKLVRVTHVSTGDMDTVDATDNGPYPFYVRSPIVRKVDRYTFDTDAVLMSGDGAGAGRIFHRVSGPFGCHQRVYCIEFSEQITRDFGFYYLSTFFPMQVDAGSAKSTVDSIRKPMLNGMPIAFPSVSEQRVITGFIDRKTAEIDRLVGKLEREVELLERYRRELIARTVTRGLDPDVPMRDSGIDWIDMAPAVWKTASISVVTDENRVKNADLSEKNLLSLSYGRIIRKDIDLAFGLLPASFDSYQIVEPGYIVLRMTDLQNDKRSLRSALAKERGIITSAYISLKVRGPILNEYLAWLLRSYDLAKVFYSLGGGVRQSASYKEIGKIPILVPPMEEQQKIADFLEEKSAQIDSTIEGINRQIELLGKYRKQVINDVVTGKVRVGEVA
ncbi:restriction endonuclease subunit S [Dermabacter hominis]|uniref:restriction endonuclease subunit S n=1 Tax=Dermabacter hominis TaxID=36740 RepID=UPI0021A4118A|nr:restriction endonuclease subunit S [Dermabacter hominis]MCT2055847.1 restriction endonuclease subunit S [Dermabacter hominis]MCT2082712.1 restriction endonuclease subunit S [Dermabacter hominis]MCT2091034.1 restriction endonuclease subunit S [Dermabacter hominis]MCT2189896.1 restriction endonuclease subunit S [Dermabacter hominis]MCT2226526.1 restriction endonuclease subunit S [Dermabacter hominis]